MKNFVKLASLIYLVSLLISNFIGCRLYNPHFEPVVSSNITNVRCLLYNDWNVYDLNPLKKDSSLP